MSHMPPVPPANRSNKGFHATSGAKTDTSKSGKGPANAAEQGDTANTTEINLALALAQAGIKNVDFATVWGLGHTMAERSGDATTNFIAWVKESAAS